MKRFVINGSVFVKSLWAIFVIMLVISITAPTITQQTQHRKERRFKILFNVHLYPKTRAEHYAIKPNVMEKIRELHDTVVSWQKRVEVERAHAEAMPHDTPVNIELRVVAFHECGQTEAQLKEAAEYLNRCGEVALKAGFKYEDLVSHGWRHWQQ